MNSKISEALAVVLLIVFIFAASWLFVCAMAKAIFFCFGWAFTLKIGTGIWLYVWATDLLVVFIQGGSE